MEHTIKIEFKEGAKRTQQKGIRVPLQLQKAVDEGIKNLLAAGHIERTDKITDEMFIKTSRDNSQEGARRQIALDSRSLNTANLKDKYHMPNLENLMESVAEIITGKQEGDVWFTSLDMVYAYVQRVLHPETATKFQIIGGETTGTYAFKTWYYGLATMPPEFQKIMDKILHKTKNTFSFIDDILVVTKEKKEENMVTVEETINAMDEAGIRLKIGKCKIAKPDTEWLGYKMSMEELNH